MNSANLPCSFEQREIPTDGLGRNSELLGQRGDIDAPSEASTRQDREMSFFGKHCHPQFCTFAPVYFGISLFMSV
jgi:hypothetical protein